MAIITTGSTVYSLNKGLAVGMNYGAGSPYIWATEVLAVNGAPSTVVTVQTGSQVALDVLGQQFYMGLAAGGSSWIKLGSVQ